MENHKTTDLKPVFNVGPSNEVSLAGWWWPTLSSCWILSPPHQRNKHCDSQILSPSFWIRACLSTIWKHKKNNVDEPGIRSWTYIVNLYLMAVCLKRYSCGFVIDKLRMRTWQRSQLYFALYLLFRQKTIMRKTRRKQSISFTGHAKQRSCYLWLSPVSEQNRTYILLVSSLSYCLEH